MRKAAVLLLGASCLNVAHATVTREDYKRAATLGAKYRDLPENIVHSFHWVDGEHALIYNKGIRGGHEFVLIDADTLVKAPAFDHARIAAALSKARHEEIKADELPFDEARLLEHRSVLEFSIAWRPWRCDLKEYACAPADGDRDGDSDDTNASSASRNNLNRTVASPDKKWEALIENYNVVVRTAEHKEQMVMSTDGSEGNYYTFDSIVWSPDSSKLVVYRVRPGYRRMLHFIESSPATQLQPLYPEVLYTKPGDVLDLQQPVLFDVAEKRAKPIANDLFLNPYELSRASWWKDSRGFTFEYNQRGHQVYRVIEVNAKTAAPRTLIDEQSATFIDYRPLIANQADTGKEYRYDIADGKEILWASERDGWEHLYLLDGSTGMVKNQITHGNWVVRSVDRVDEARRQIWFEVSGMRAGEDPYFVHAYRINFDGTGLTPLTESAGNHRVEYSSDGTLYADLVSTIDTAPVFTLYGTESNAAIGELEQGNIDKLKAAGWKAPEPFMAKGRDAKTEIWGVVWKPANFDAKKHYPVIENIYAGPQGSFVPKTFTTRVEPLTELGFVVVQIDGMGTNNRSRAFHDVAWKNFKDAGFEDRILWHKAYAASHPWYDILRVGIFGTSAGGQSAMGALLFHPEFYQAAVANSGCHDNRMDKLWWNEQWMGWPIGPQYSESSNVDNAWRLKGKLMLVVGELDDNVDPSSTFQVADRLEKANKMFDLLYVPGGKHGAGEEYGYRKLEDFFVHNLLQEESPLSNADVAPLTGSK